MELKKRHIFDELLSQKDDHKISFLIGPRQVGKTTLLRQLHEEICTRQGSRGLFLDLDVFSNFEKVNSFENMTNTLRLEGFDEKEKSFFYLFLDEFQRYADLSIVLKNIYDHFENVKIYASGSSSLQIKNQIQESLAGRKKINTIYPLNFLEFLEFKGEHVLMEKTGNLNKLSGTSLDKITPELSAMLEEFLVFGGYPEVVLQKSNAKKIEVLESIFDLYIKKDLVEYMNIKKIGEVKKLIEYLAVNNGQKIKFETIAKTCLLGPSEAKNYIEILKETYLLFELRPFFTNKNKEIVKIPKIYFIDNGVRNYFVQNFNKTSLRNDAGFLFEGMVVSELLKKGTEPDSIKFWQDKNKHEVDIVIEEGERLTPIEVKFKTDPKQGDEAGLNIFMSEYKKARQGFLVNLGAQAAKGKTTYLLPYNLPLRL